MSHLNNASIQAEFVLNYDLLNDVIHNCLREIVD